MISVAVEIAILIIVAIILFKTKGYLFKDVLFIEGIISAVIGIFTSMSGNSKGLSIQSMGRNDAQITGIDNLKITEMEGKTFKDYFKSVIFFTFNAVSLIICGVICIALNFIN